MHIDQFLTRLIFGFALVFAQGCEGRNPTPETRWRFVGGDTVQLQTNAPVLAASLKLPESLGIRPLLVSNVAALWWQLTTSNHPASPLALASARQLVPDLLDGLSIGETVVTSGGRREFIIAFPSDPARAQIWRTGWSNFFAAARPGESQASVAYEQGWVIAVSDEKVIDVRAARKELATIPAEVGMVLHLETGGPLPASTLKVVVHEGLVESELRLKTLSSLPSHPARWDLPDIIRSPLIQFTAAREIQAWLKDFSFFARLADSSVPTQFFLWGQSSNSPFSAFQTYACLEVQNPEALLHHTEKTLREYLPGTNAPYGIKFEFLNNTNDAGFSIKNFPYVTPRFYPLKEGDRSYVTAGMFVPAPSTNLIPPQILGPLNQTNLVYYDWEATSQTAKNWNALAQVLQIAHNRNPRPTGGAAWLLAVAAPARFSATEGLIAGPNEVVFHRRSALGLTSAELATLSTWLDWNQLFERDKPKLGTSRHSK